MQESARIQYEKNNMNLMQDTSKLANELRDVKALNEKMHHEINMSEIRNELNASFRKNLTKLLNSNEVFSASDYNCDLNSIVSNIVDNVAEFKQASSEDFFTNCKANIKEGIEIVESVKKFKDNSALYYDAVEKSKHQTSKLNEDENVIV